MRRVEGSPTVMEVLREEAVDIGFEVRGEVVHQDVPTLAHSFREEIDVEEVEKVALVSVADERPYRDTGDVDVDGHDDSDLVALARPVSPGDGLATAHSAKYLRCCV